MKRNFRRRFFYFWLVFVDLLGLYSQIGQYSDTVILPNGWTATLKDTSRAMNGCVHIRDIIDILNMNGYSSDVKWDQQTRVVSGYTTSHLGRVDFRYTLATGRTTFSGEFKQGFGVLTNASLGYFVGLSCSDKTYVELKSFAKAAGFGIGLRFYIKGTIGADGYLPISGYEPKSEPWEWVGMADYYYDEASIQKTTNCYAYALDLMCNPFSGELFLPGQTLQPGSLSSGEHNNLTMASIPYNTPGKATTIIVNAVRIDSLAYGNDFARSNELEKAPAGMYKVALALANDDYHWYRQNPDGTWSHKQSTGQVSNVDSKDKPINNPKTADRGNYEHFGGFFIAGKSQ